LYLELILSSGELATDAVNVSGWLLF